MNTAYAFLDCYDRDCLALTAEELQVKYPRIPIGELNDNQRMIKEQMSELNKRRFLRWLKQRSWVLYFFGEY